MKQDLIEKGFIPFDKSWIIRMGILDLINGYEDCKIFLKENYDNLGEDLKALYLALNQWSIKKEIDVGESATLYRFLKFISWSLNENKIFVLNGTLKNRNISNNKDIVSWPVNKLLTLDNGTSQWASAAILLGNPSKISNPPYKVQITYDAVIHWKSRRDLGKSWLPRFDKTILNQMLSYLRLKESGKISFIPEHSEDYCFARAFELVTAEEGEKRWPSLKGHESDRIKEMEEALKQKDITSKDHRVVQAVAMLKGSREKIKYPEVVNKSWPQFWAFLDYTNNKL